ncbi:hypothetical protein EDB19DRAFT_2034567 [Suillus lakei]|nr:hypothetical protein EDB19DRAFT_2034567 [Suillus lakei]
MTQTLPSSLNHQPFHSHVPNPGYRPGPQPATPAPSPPPSPKPKNNNIRRIKIDHSYFPSRGRADSALTMIASYHLHEADKLYNRHMYVSLSLCGGRKKITSEDFEIAEPLLDVAMLDAKIAESVAAIGDAVSSAQEHKARERKEDVMRLKRVETICHMSPKTMAALPKSPAGNRRSSSGAGLRPVLPFGLDDENPIEF